MPIAGWRPRIFGFGSGILDQETRVLNPDMTGGLGALYLETGDARNARATGVQAVSVTDCPVTKALQKQGNAARPVLKPGIKHPKNPAPGERIPLRTIPHQSAPIVKSVPSYVPFYWQAIRDKWLFGSRFPGRRA
jgi:hypothetical protein